MTMMHSMQDLGWVQKEFCRERIMILTTHMPFQAAIKVAIPIKKPMAERALQPRLAELSVRITAHRKPPTIPPIPRPRAKMTRGRFPLQIV
jgi:hypothetical protein